MIACKGHITNCLAINHTESVWKRKLKVSFIIYGNFEYILKPLIDNNVNGPSNENIKILLFVVMFTN